MVEGKEAEQSWEPTKQRWVINHLHDTLSLWRRGVGFAWLPLEVVTPLIRSSITDTVTDGEPSVTQMFYPPYFTARHLVLRPAYC